MRDRQPARRCQCASCAARACAAPSAPIGTISPVSSATAMNSPARARRARDAASAAAPRRRTIAPSSQRRSAGSTSMNSLALERAAQVAARREALGARASCIARVEAARAPRPACLRAVHRDVGVAHQRRRRRRRRRDTRDADARAHASTSWPSTHERLARAAPDRVPRSPARVVAAIVASPAATTNSSPPSARDGVAARAMQRRAAAPTSTSSASPAAWPSVSLTILKRSRSRKSTATVWPPRAPVRAARCDLVLEQTAIREAA